MSKGGYTAIAERIFERSKSGCIAGMSHVKGFRKGTDLACGIQHEGHAISAILAQQSNCPNLLFHISVIPAMNLECTKSQVQQSLSSMTAMAAAVKPSDGNTILLTALRRIAMVVVANVDTSTKVAQRRCPVWGVQCCESGDDQICTLPSVHRNSLSNSSAYNSPTPTERFRSGGEGPTTRGSI